MTVGIALPLLAAGALTGLAMAGPAQAQQAGMTFFVASAGKGNGADLGGLAVALTLGKQGRRVRVLEATAELGAIGYGIQLGPNVFPMFERLGLVDAVLARSAGALFSRSYERGERVHLAMLSRGYTGRMPRCPRCSTCPAPASATATPAWRCSATA